MALVVQNPPADAGDITDMGSIPGLGRFPWRKTWQPTPVFLPGESHGRRTLVGTVHRVEQNQTWLKRLSTHPQDLVQFSHSVMSDSLWPHGLQHARPPCPSPTPRVDSNSCPLSWWCHPTISFSVVSFSYHLQSSPAPASFPMNQFFASGGQSIRVSAST